MEALLTSEGVRSVDRTPDRIAVPTDTPLDGNKRTVIKSAKLMLDLDRTRKDSQTPQSRGFAFVEFTHHAYALACLRELNNNPEYEKIATEGSGHGRSRLIVEFTVENFRKVAMLKQREEKSKAVATGAKDEEDDGTETQVRKGSRADNRGGRNEKRHGGQRKHDTGKKHAKQERVEGRKRKRGA